VLGKKFVYGWLLGFRAGVEKKRDACKIFLAYTNPLRELLLFYTHMKDGWGIRAMKNNIQI